mgnify:CR=1 FL=1
MKESYTLNPTNTILSLEESFPKLEEGKRVGIFISGGMESTLIAKICFERYGKDNCIGLYSDDAFSGTDVEKNISILSNIKKAEDNLDIKMSYVKFNLEKHFTDMKASVQEMLKYGAEQYNIQFVMWGFTKLFFDIYPIKKIEDLTTDKIKEECYSDPEKYSTVIEEFHLPTDQYTSELVDMAILPMVHEMLEHEHLHVICPFKNLNKPEVVDLYRQLDLVDLLYKTRSCLEKPVRDDKHCGRCFNCQQRFDAFRILGSIDDQTTYVSDTIKINRYKLESVLSLN